MNNEKLIKEIYNSTINEVLNNCEDDIKEELSVGYDKYLKNLYLTFDLNFGNRSFDELVNIFTNLEKSKWKDLNINSKLSELVLDQAFEKIKKISSEGYNYAESRVNMQIPSENDNIEMLLPPVIDEKTALESIKYLEMYFEQVKEFNKDIAQYYVSEGIMDFLFASGKTEDMSLRIGRR